MNEDGNPFVNSDDVEKPASKPRAPRKDYRAIAKELQRVLRKIARDYMAPEQMRKAVDRPRDAHYGLSYEEALEMAYENIQAEADAAVTRSGRL